MHILLRTWLLAIVMILVSSNTIAQTPETATRRVLVLNAYHEGFHWTDRIMAGIRSVFDDEENIELFIDYMDTKRCSDTAYIEKLRDLYEHKYKLLKFDAIVSSDDLALDFLLQHRDDLFADVPVVFCGINYFKPERIAGHSQFTGVYETYDVVGTVDLILRLHPEAKNLAVVLDDSRSGKTCYGLLKKAEPAFAQRLKFNYITDMKPDKLQYHLNHLPKDTIVLWAIYLRTPDGVPLSSKESVELVVESSGLPTYCIWDVVGQGVVGGIITSPNFQGRSAARRVLQLMAGATVESMPVSGSPMVHLFDYEAMQRFGISESNLPQDSIVLNKPFSFYQTYQGRIWLTVGFVVTLLVIVMLLVHHVHRRTQAERALAISQKQLAQSRKMDAIGQLAGGVAHDFNNILSGINGAAQLLDSSQSLDDDGKEYIEIIDNAVIRAADLTSKLLAFGRKGKLSSTTSDLHELIDDAFTILSASVNKDIKIYVEEKADSSIIVGDNPALQNALINLGINSCHAMPDGGELRFSTVNVELDVAYCQASSFTLEPGEYIQLEVQDTGSGIPKEDLKKIFEPFFTTKAPGKGTGLGLAAVYGTIQDHHGAIEVFSEYGVGTTFRLLWPCSSLPINTPLSSHELVQGSGLVLLVDDEDIVRKTGYQIIRDMGYDVITAEDGIRAVEIFAARHGEIDLVIMDMIMPEMNGSEAFGRMREISPDCKVVITSGFARDENVDQLREQGLSGFLHKPYSSSALSRVIEQTIANTA